MYERRFFCDLVMVDFLQKIRFRRTNLESFSRTDKHGSGSFLVTITNNKVHKVSRDSIVLLFLFSVVSLKFESGASESDRPTN